jgi:hypothetical protein
MGLKNWIKAFGSVSDDIAASGLDAGKKASKMKSLKKVTAHLDEIGDDFSKLDPKMFQKAGGKLDPDAMEAFKRLLRKAGVPKSQRKALSKQMSAAAGGLSGKQLKEVTGSTLGEAGDALKKADSFFEKNKNLLMAAGLSATGIAMVMLLVGNKSPAAVAGIPKEDLDPGSTDGIDDDDAGDAGYAGDDDDDEGDGGGNRKKRVFEKFLKDWGVYIIIFIVMIFIGFAVYLMTRGSTETLSENSG